jgi:probable rRNA maturation factor
MTALPDWPEFPDTPENEIGFSAADVDYTPEDAALLAQWVIDCIRIHDRQVGSLDFIFCSDEYLLQLNRTWLQHDTLTDILTFSLGEMTIGGDIFISLERIQENARELGVSFRDERDRVIIHGVLHMLGYDDHTETDKEAMRQQEDAALKRRGW